MMSHTIHIVSRFDGIGGTEMHAKTLAEMLRPSAQVALWADEATPTAAHYGARPINTFGGSFPRGGTLIFVGTHQRTDLWLDHAKPRRLIVICNLFSARRIFTFLTSLERPTLPTAELAFISAMLRDALGLPGVVSPTLIDLKRFHPVARNNSSRFTIGRHSRDDLLKHHPDDPSLYAMLGWSGCRTRLMGASCLQSVLHDSPHVDILPVGAEAPEQFLASLDCFTYRTHPTCIEAGGRVIMEAMASGLPVVAHPAGGYAEWIKENKNGYLVATQEAAFERLLELSTNRNLASTLGIHARETALRLSGEESRGTYLEWLSV